MIMGTLKESGRIVDNFRLDATSTWDSTTTNVYTCPTGRRWFLLPSVVKITQNATAVIYHYNSSDKVTAVYLDKTASTGTYPWPQTTYPYDIIIVEAGEYLKLIAGAAQDANAYMSARVVEVMV